MNVPVIVYELTAYHPDNVVDVVTTLRTRKFAETLLALIKGAIKDRNIITSALDVAIVERGTAVEAESIAHAMSQGYVIDYATIDAALVQQQAVGPPPENGA